MGLSLTMLKELLDAFFETSEEYARRREKEARTKIREYYGREPTEKEVEDYLLS